MAKKKMAEGSKAEEKMDKMESGGKKKKKGKRKAKHPKGGY
jgi:hypothetical protein